MAKKAQSATKIEEKPEKAKKTEAPAATAKVAKVAKKTAPETLGGMLVRLREDKGWSQMVACARADISQPTLCALEMDATPSPRVRTLILLENIYGVPGELIACVKKQMEL